MRHKKDKSSEYDNSDDDIPSDNDTEIDKSQSQDQPLPPHACPPPTPVHEPYPNAYPTEISHNIKQALAIIDHQIALLQFCIKELATLTMDIESDVNDGTATAADDANVVAIQTTILLMQLKQIENLRKTLLDRALNSLDILNRHYDIIKEFISNNNL